MEQQKKEEVDCNLEQTLEILSKLGHDLSNLLGAVNGCFELLKRKVEINPRNQQLVSVIDSGLAKAIGLSTKIRGYRRMISLEDAESTTVSSALYEVIELINKNSQIPLTVNLEINKDCQVKIDSFGLVQMLVGVCMNSVEAMESIEDKTIIMFLDAVDLPSINPVGINSGKYAKISVVDHGHGISKKSIEQLFTPFWSTKESEVGTGFGLSLVLTKKGIEDMGGKLMVESLQDRGTAVHFYFPTCNELREETVNGKATGS